MVEVYLSAAQDPQTIDQDLEKVNAILS